ncbi:MAG: STAS/SEC14 domain-containing protein [Bacteroidales bacterium]
MAGELQIVKLNQTQFLFGTDKASYLGNSIVRVDAIGDQTSDMVLLIEASFRDFLLQFGDRIKLLVDINFVGKNPPPARRLWQSMARDPLVERVAVCGLHPVSQVVASFVMGPLKMDKVRFFQAESEAMDWLKQNSTI